MAQKNVLWPARRFATDRNKTRRMATVFGLRDNPKPFETARNKKQRQGGSEAAKTLVVEHKGIVEHWWLVLHSSRLT